ncbi:MAG: putative toxin-antitoxin system toxin component, PIN family [Acidobacteria bacterium]|nr:putative toxin-antitoxin system toxin component, PIN family [Acidobacteriota bacterium]MBU1475219.1 putative toxin-antitoxin system toxin component, PIN family [Acidobacteriota bacterium]
MKVFLDTNVLVSASTTRGLCADVLREVLLSHDLFLADCLIEELKFVLQGKLGIPTAIVDEYIGMLRSDAVFTKRHVELLSGAAASGTDIFVTGDKELLALEKALDMVLVSPRVFWETLKIKTTG